MDKTEVKPPTIDQLKERELKIGQPFNFFLTDSSDPKKKFELAHLAGIGTVTGIAQVTELSQQIHGPNEMIVTFEVDSQAAKPKSSADMPILGPAQDLYLEARNQKQPRLISKGRIEHNQYSTVIKFDSWQDISGFEIKVEIKKVIDERHSNPLTIDKHLLSQTTFNFLKENQL